MLNLLSRISRVPKYRRFNSATAPVVVGQDLVEEMNQLQNVLGLLQAEFSFPQIVVVGSQSSGKSSVLENIVGRDFLPRGTGIVTRRPLILQLMPIPSSSSSSSSSPSSSFSSSSSSSSSSHSATAWAEFAHLPNQRFTDFQQVKHEIARETDRVAPGQGVSASPITLRVFSAGALPLTLVDLPGITRVPTGNQPRDIEQRLREMILQYTSSDSAIVLAVHAATQDLATSDALQLAHAVDRQGARTLGVLTKVDMMDRGTDLCRVLDGREFPLKLGYVPVVNRGQREIDGQQPIAEALAAERSFFDGHPAYQFYADRCGTAHLARLLNGLLTAHIRRTLPQLSQQIHQRLAAAREELAGHGRPLSSDAAEQGWLLLQLVNGYAALYSATISGQSADDAVLETERLNAGARLRVLFHETFYDALRGIDPTEGLSLAEYRTAIRNAAGPRPSLFVPDPAFQLLVKKQLQRLKAPCMHLVDLCHTEMLRIVAQLEPAEVRRFPALKAQLQAITGGVLQEQLGPTQAFVEQLINIELAYINTNHPEFSVLAHRQVSQERVPPPTSGRDGFDGNSSSHSSNSNSNSSPSNSSSSSSSSFNPITRFFFGSKAQETTSQEQHGGSMHAQQQPNDATLMGEKPSEREVIQIRLLKQLLKDYFNIVTRNLQDTVIKAVWHILIDGSRKHLHHALVSQLYKPEKCALLLREHPSVATKRIQLAEKIQVYQNAAQILNEFEQKRRFE